MDENKQNEPLYFAAKEPNKTASTLLRRADHWFKSLDTTGYLGKLRTMWAAYHGAYYSSDGDPHAILFSGEQGELTQMGVNHLRNIGQHILNMITSTRPMMQARSINTDYKSLTQTKLANGLLDYYMRDHRLEEYLKVAVEYAIVFGSGYVKMEWNSTKGDLYDYNDELGIEIREGDLEFTNLSPFDVLFDNNREDNKHDWVLVRTFKNRHDLAAKYPEYSDKIQGLPSKIQMEAFSAYAFTHDETDLVAVYEFYHKRTDALPDGRYILFMSEDIVLLDSPMPYRSLPVYCISPSRFLGTPFGYTPLFDLIPLQDAVNSLYSTILTNQTAFGVQNILVPKGADVGISELSGGLNIIEANTQFGEIKPLNLTNTPKEIFDFVGMLEKTMETISGVNAVSRGNPDPNLRSGNALALVQSMTLQFLSGLQQSYVALIEDLGTGIINTLKDHAAVPRVRAIVGKSNRSYLKEFTGDDLDSVSRVVVDIGNPLARTTAGRVEMAEQMLQMGVIKTPEQYFSVINTGQLDVMTEDTQSELLLVKSENERLVTGDPVIAAITDDHLLHIKEHRVVLADPELRFNQELAGRVVAHIQEHIDLLRNTDPQLLQLLGQQPLGPAGGSPAQPQQQMPPDASMQGQAPDMMQPPSPVPQGGLPTPPQVDPNLLANPAMADQLPGTMPPGVPQ